MNVGRDEKILPFASLVKLATKFERKREMSCESNFEIEIRFVFFREKRQL